jgi:hypothetical protein
MAFEFDPAKLDQANPAHDEFSFTVPNSDLDNAVARRDLDPMNIPIPDGGIDEILEGATTENEGGRIRVLRGTEFTVISFGFTPLVQLQDAGEGNFFERYKKANVDRAPQFEGNKKIFENLARITALQYQFGINPDDFDPAYPTAPARFSFQFGRYVDNPRYVITESFEDALQKAREKPTKEKLTAGLYSYFKYIDPTKDTSGFDENQGITIPATHRNGVFDQGGDSALANRSSKPISPADIAISRQYPGDSFDVIYEETGDLYMAEGHNLDLVSEPRIVSMVAVGSIARLCRELRQQANT